MVAAKGNQYAKGNKGGKGAPTKYGPKTLRQAQLCARAGFSDFETAEAIGISERTLNEWKLKHQEFAAALKLDKGIADDRVERSLYERAMGYSHKDVEIRTVRGKVVEVSTIKHYPPDTAAAFIWLKNRRRNEWRDRHADEFTATAVTTESGGVTLKIVSGVERSPDDGERAND